nr:uncharacterized protein LOC100182944 [Ciona intestinalis]|eukprot:XP_009860235.1 uncharacterized protein LOC100182944 [Ciona intestinalis]
MRQTFEQLKEGNCLVGSEYKRVTTTELCPCTDIDYECGYGYITTSSGCKKVVGKGSPIDDIRDILDEDTTPTIPPCVNGLRKMPTQYRKVPGDQCQNDLEGKLFTIVNCSIVVTPPPPPTIHVKLLNKTNEVKIGEVLHFTAVSNSETVWSVIRTAEPKDKITTRPVKRDEISLNPTKPGAYQVRASNPKHPTVSDTMLVSFWYPIENVLIYCPPVVEVDTPFNATATLATKYGLRGTSSLLGRVSYIWSTENSDYKEVSENLISIRPTKLKDYGVMVTVNNKVSFSSGHGNFTVKKYVQTVVVPLESNTNLTDDLLTHTWLRDLQAMFARALIEKQLINILHANQMLQNKRFHLFIEPNLPLTAKLLFSHDKDGQPSSDALLKIASIIEQKLARDKIVLHLPHGVVLTSKVPYMINAKGVYIYMKKSGTSPGIIVLIILLCVLLITSIVAMVRRYSRNSRWNSYLGSWKPHLRSSRGRSQDHTAIVDQDQLMENELDTMDISTTIQGNMQIG